MVRPQLLQKVCPLLVRPFPQGLITIHLIQCLTKLRAILLPIQEVCDGGHREGIALRRFDLASQLPFVTVYDHRHAVHVQTFLSDESETVTKLVWEAGKVFDWNRAHVNGQVVPGRPFVFVEVDIGAGRMCHNSAHEYSGN